MEETPVKRFLVNTWPSIYRLINELFYLILQAIKEIIRIATKEIKNG